jgi:hypothetical protein
VQSGRHDASAGSLCGGAAAQIGDVERAQGIVLFQIAFVGFGCLSAFQIIENRCDKWNRLALAENLIDQLIIPRPGSNGCIRKIRRQRDRLCVVNGEEILGFEIGNEARNQLNRDCLHV